MKKLVVAVLTISTFTVAPVYAYASADPEEIRDACSQVAIDEGVPADELAAFIAECIAMNLESTEDVGGEDAEKAEVPDLLPEE